MIVTAVVKNEGMYYPSFHRVFGGGGQKGLVNISSPFYLIYFYFLRVLKSLYIAEMGVNVTAVVNDATLLFSSLLSGFVNRTRDVFFLLFFLLTSSPLYINFFLFLLKVHKLRNGEKKRQLVND